MKKISLLFAFLILISCEVVPPTPTIYRSNPSVSESGEFATLLQKDALDKKKVNAQVITYLLNDDDPTDRNTGAVIENTSECDIILRVVGVVNNQIYNLPIAARSKNQFVLRKGSYTLKANICEAKYYSQKNIVEPLLLKLSRN